MAGQKVSPRKDLGKTAKKKKSWEGTRVGRREMQLGVKKSGDNEKAHWTKIQTVQLNMKK